MAIQKSIAVRNAELDVGETTIGVDAVLRIYTGAPPADCATAASGTLLVSITLPTDWAAAASGGTKAKLGTWQANASAAGTAGWFGIWDSTVTTRHYQGTVTATSGGGDMELDNTSIGNGQQVTVTTFTRTAGGA